MTSLEIVRRTLVGVVLAAVCCAIVGCAERPVGIVLTYQVDRSVIGPTATVEMRSLVAAVNERLGRAGRARITGGEELEVDIYGALDAEQLYLVKRLIGAGGVLEFRITADSTRAEDKPEIDQARLLPPSQKDVLIGGNKVAEWVTYDAEEFGGPDEQDIRGIVKRMAGDRPEALVLIDPWNVTGDHLRNASKGFVELGGPAVNFMLDARGAAYFRQLTSQNRPNPATPGRFRYLGIILDKRLLSAPSIRETISNSGQISGGGMDEAEVDFIVDILNAGALPYPIRLVAERSTGLAVSNAGPSGTSTLVLVALAVGFGILLVVILVALAVKTR